jgi:hypothetical protein
MTNKQILLQPLLTLALSKIFQEFRNLKDSLIHQINKACHRHFSLQETKSIEIESLQLSLDYKY